MAYKQYQYILWHVISLITANMACSLWFLERANKSKLLVSDVNCGTEKLCVNFLLSQLIPSSWSYLVSLYQISGENTQSYCRTTNLNYRKGDRVTPTPNSGVSRRWGGLWSRKSNYLCIYISHIVITSLIVPPLSPPVPSPPNNQPFYPAQQTHHRSFVWIQRICFPLSKSRSSLMIGQRRTSKS